MFTGWKESYSRNRYLKILLIKALTSGTSIKGRSVECIIKKSLRKFSKKKFIALYIFASILVYYRFQVHIYILDNEIIHHQEVRLEHLIVLEEILRKEAVVESQDQQPTEEEVKSEPQEEQSTEEEVKSEPQEEQPPENEKKNKL